MGSGYRLALEMGERLRERSPLRLVRRERARQALLALGAEAEVGDAAVRAGALPLDQAGLLGSPYELGDRALRKLQPLRELGHGRALAVVGSALDHQQQHVALRG